MQHRVEAAYWHVLTDDHEVGGRVTAANDGQDVGMGEYPQFGIFLVEVSRYPGGALSQG